MSEAGRERFDDLKYAYALGALSEEERREFESYLEAHPELRAEVEELVSVGDFLALAPQEYEPPPDLRRKLLSRIEGETRASLADRLSYRTRLRQFFGPGGLAAAVVALLIVAGLFVWNFSLREENQDLRGELQTRQTYELQGSGAAQNVRGKVVETGDGQAVLVAQNLPSLPQDKVYEAWIMRNETPEPAGLFEPRDGEVTAAPIEGSIEDADAVAVTAEPEGGSQTPQGDILLTAELS